MSKYRIINMYQQSWILAELDNFASCKEYSRNRKLSVIVENIKTGKCCNINCTNRGYYFHVSHWYEPTFKKWIKPLEEES